MGCGGSKEKDASRPSSDVVESMPAKRRQIRFENEGGWQPVEDPEPLAVDTRVLIVDLPADQQHVNGCFATVKALP